MTASTPQRFVAIVLGCAVLGGLAGLLGATFHLSPVVQGGLLGLLVGALLLALRARGERSGGKPS